MTGQRELLLIELLSDHVPHLHSRPQTQRKTGTKEDQGDARNNGEHLLVQSRANIFLHLKTGSTSLALRIDYFFVS